MPASATVKLSPLRVNVAWRRETVTSSRKISLSAWRPAVVTSLSRRNLLPAPGPRWTTSSAEPTGSASTAAASTGLSWRSEEISEVPLMLMVAVESPTPTPAPGPVSSAGASVASFVPHYEQNFAPSGFALPQLVQYGIDDRLLSNPQGRAEVDGFSEPTRQHPAVGSLPTYLGARPEMGSGASLAERRLVRRGVHEGVDRGRVGGHDLVQPATTVRIAIDQLGGRVEALVDGHHLTLDGCVDVADRLGGLELTAGPTGRDRLADSGQGHVHDVAELVLGVVGDPDPDGPLGLAGAADPLVLLGVLQVVGVHGSPRSSSRFAGASWPWRADVPAGYSARAQALTRGPVAGGRGPARSLGLGELGGHRLADGGDVERLLLLDVDRGAGVLELGDGT